ncbi:MAG: hypothetical protein IJZ87_04455 [Bacteroidales bacterium]|nr:hypothetical protein [Bacteroidales bacterium]
MMTKYFLYRHAWRFKGTHHNETELTKKEVNKLFMNGGWLVRNTYDFDKKEENSFWYIIKDNFYGLAENTTKERTKIRKSLKTYDYRIIDVNIIKERGFELYKEVLRDYQIKDRKVTYDDFLSLFNNEYECWGCFEKKTNEFIGFSINYIWRDACQYEVSAILPKYKHNSTYPYYGLIYSMNKYYLGEKKLKYVSDGSRTITEHSNIQDFLMHNFKFRKAYCKLKVHYKWWVGVVVKLLFPFRNVIPFRNVKAILKMEEYSRKSQ